MKEYILKNKNDEIIRFKINSFTDEKTLQQIKEIKILEKNEKLFPIQFQNSKNLEETLARFISSRKVPQNRSFAKKIIQETGNDDFMGYIDISFGLSLDDSIKTIAQIWQQLSSPVVLPHLQASAVYGFYSHQPYYVAKTSKFSYVYFDLVLTVTKIFYFEFSNWENPVLFKEKNIFNEFMPCFSHNV